MNKFLILLLFVLVKNSELDGITVYDTQQMEKLQGKSIYQLTVKKWEEFYIRLPILLTALDVYTLRNYKTIPDALEVFTLDGRADNLERRDIHIGYIISKGFIHYFKFKALKESQNEISLKFSFGKLKDNTIIKINISKK